MSTIQKGSSEKKMGNRLTKSYQKQVLVLAVRAGELMMRNGAELYRVEDTIERICQACGIPYVEVFATPTGIIVSTDSGGDDGEVITKVRRIRSNSVDLSRISELNSFSRIFTTTEYSPAKGMEKLREITAMKPFNIWVRLLGAGCVAASFSAALAPTLLNTLFAFIVGVLSYAFSMLLARYDINYFMNGMTCCGMAALITMICSSTGLIDDYSAIIIGTIMLFVPGAAITNSMRDLLSGDMLSGIAKMAEALLVAVAQAAGVGIVLKIWFMMGGLQS